jgi:hypothetical protein
MAEPGKETAASPPQPQDTEATAGPAAAALDSPPSAKPAAIQPPPQQQSDAAVAGQPQETAEADDQGQQDAPTTAEQGPVLTPASQVPEATANGPATAAAPDSPPSTKPAAIQQSDAAVADQPQENVQVKVKQAAPTPAEQGAVLPPASQAPEATGDGPAAAAPDSPPSTKPAAIQPPLQQQSDAAVAGQPQGTAEADGQGQQAAPITEEQGAVLPPVSQAPEAGEEPAEPRKSTTETNDDRAAAPKQTDSVSQAPPQEPSDAAGQPRQKEEAAGRPDTPATLPASPETTPSQEKAVPPVSEAGRQLPLPAPPQQQEQAGGAAGEAEEKGSAPAVQEGVKKTRARRLWDIVRDAVRLKRHRSKSAPPPEGEGRETKPVPESDGKNKPASQKEEKKPRRKDSDPDNDKVEDDAQETARTRCPPLRRAESKAGAAGAGEPDDPAASHKVRKLQRAVQLLQRILAWYNRHRRSPQKGEQDDAPTEEGEDGKQAKPKTAPEDKSSKTKAETTTPAGQDKEESTQTKEKLQHPKWAEEEKRLETILEEAFTKLLATEYKQQLRGINRRCLLTFSVFELASEVKKQAMVYWWGAQFCLPYHWRGEQTTNSGKNSAPDSTPEEQSKCLPVRRKTAAAGNRSSAAAPGHEKGPHAEDVLIKLSGLGFLEPIKNYCCGVIHGCKVNPLAHWMVKRLARDDSFADLDSDGRPTDSQIVSGILCLTAGYRKTLHDMRIAELKLETGSNPKASRTGSTTKGQEETPAEVISTCARFLFSQN